MHAEPGAEVASLVVNRWRPPPDPEALRAAGEAAAVGEIDAVVFTSAPGAEAWLSAAEEHGVGRLVVSRFQDGSVLSVIRI